MEKASSQLVKSTEGFFSSSSLSSVIHVSFTASVSSSSSFSFSLADSRHSSEVRWLKHERGLESHNKSGHAVRSRHEYLQIVESVVESVVVEEVVIISRSDSIQTNAARSISQSKKEKVVNSHVVIL